MKSHGGTMDFMCFSKGFHSNTFRDIIIKGFNCIITKWRTQSHSCSWAIQHESPLKIQYNNFEHTTVHNIYNVSRSYHFADDIFIHPSPKIMADFFQTQKSTWCPHPICTIFGRWVRTGGGGGFWRKMGGGSVRWARAAAKNLNFGRGYPKKRK